MNIQKITSVCILCLSVFAISCGSKKNDVEVITQETISSQGGSFEDTFLSTVSGKDIITLVSLEGSSDLIIPLVSFSDDGNTMTLAEADVMFVSADSEGVATYTSDMGSAIITLDGTKPISIMLDDGTDMLSDLSRELHKAHGDNIGVLFVLQ